mmetsp:Transcript_21462/g.31124  ORF Transcript_21462/g.31124 Transcript_21462/m.31124 type:complete len:1202 (+) Transcript_21462:54-3659(+)
MHCEHTVEEISNLFKVADSDKDGRLSMSEVSDIMTKINSNTRPSNVELLSCMNMMDFNGDGMISEEEFLDTMLKWLGMVHRSPDTVGMKRHNISPTYSRKKVLTEMANFFRQFSPIPDFNEKQRRILSRQHGYVDMIAIHREYPSLSTDEKAATHEEIKGILLEGSQRLLDELYSLDWKTVMQGVCKVRTILSIVQLCHTSDEKFEYAPTIFQVFEGITHSGKIGSSDGSIIRRICALLTPNVPSSMQLAVYTPCLHALRDYIIGPNITNIRTNVENNVWHPDNAFTRQVLESERFPFRLVQLLDEHATVTTWNQDILAAIMRCIGAFSETNSGCLECMLRLEFRSRIVKLLRQDMIELPLLRSAIGALAVLCGFTHSFDSRHTNIPAAVGINERELFDILHMAHIILGRMICSGVYDAVAVMNIALVLKYLLPLCSPSVPLHKSIFDKVQVFYRHNWPTHSSSWYVCISLNMCLSEVLSASKDFCGEVWRETDIHSVVASQLRCAVSYPDDEVIASLIQSAIQVVRLLLEFEFVDILGDERTTDIVKHCVSLLPSSECGHCVASFLVDCMKHRSLVPVCVSRGVVDGFFGLFSKFKRNRHTLSEVLGAYVGPIYTISTIRMTVASLQELLLMDISLYTMVFNVDHVDAICHLHDVVCRELRKGSLRYSQELADMCAALLQFVEKIWQCHATIRTPIVDCISSECLALVDIWVERLNDAYAEGFIALRESEMEVDVTPGVPILSNEWVSFNSRVNISAVPLWEKGNEFRRFEMAYACTVPRDISLTMLRNRLCAMCQMDVSLFHNVNNECVPLTLQTDFSEMIRFAELYRTETIPCITIYLTANTTSSFSPVQMNACEKPLANGLHMGSKEVAIRDIKKQCARYNKDIDVNLISDFYDYFKHKNVSEIDRQLFIQALTSPQLNFEEKFAYDIFHAFDLDGNGALSLTEIAIGFAKLTNGSNDEKLELMFQAYDRDRSNALDVNELTNLVMVSAGISWDEARAYAIKVGSKVDMNGDGVLDFYEFKKAAYSGMVPLGISWSSNCVMPMESSENSTAQLSTTFPVPSLKCTHSVNETELHLNHPSLRDSTVSQSERNISLQSRQFDSTVDPPKPVLIDSEVSGGDILPPSYSELSHSNASKDSPLKTEETSDNSKQISSNTTTKKRSTPSPSSVPLTSAKPVVRESAKEKMLKNPFGKRNNIK